MIRRDNFCSRGGSAEPQTPAVPGRNLSKYKRRAEISVLRRTPNPAWRGKRPTAAVSQGQEIFRGACSCRAYNYVIPLGFIVRRFPWKINRSAGTKKFGLHYFFGRIEGVDELFESVGGNFLGSILDDAVDFESETV